MTDFVIRNALRPQVYSAEVAFIYKYPRCVDANARIAPKFPARSGGRHHKTLIAAPLAVVEHVIRHTSACPALAEGLPTQVFGLTSQP